MFGLNDSSAVASSPSGDKAADQTSLPLVPDEPSTSDAEIDRYAGIVNSIKKNLTIMPVKDSRTTSRETRLIEISYTNGDSVLQLK